MRRVYWFLVLFGLWCVGCGIWYIEAVKGINTDLNLFNPHIRWIAILEISVMLLIACLIGYGIGWTIRDQPVNDLRELVQDLEAKQDLFLADKHEAEEKFQANKRDLQSFQKNYTLKINEHQHQTESLNQEISELKDALNKLKTAENKSVQLTELENEVGALRFRAKQLEFQNLELSESHEKLKLQLDGHLQKENRKSLEPMHPFVRPLEMSEKDDLTLIKGIGPFIEKRLNMVGIYTFHQISEFTPEIIEHVTKAIEFFPNRIIRDDWVGQAERLVRES